MLPVKNRAVLIIMGLLGWAGMQGVRAQATDPEIPVTGKADPAMRSFDETVLEFMQKRHVPGGALAVVKDGRLVYARGYGWADVEKQVPVQPDSLFRLASISKPITAVAILTLAQDPKIHLDLETKVFPLLGLQPFLEPGAAEDRWLNTITIRQLLHHTGGFDRDNSGDPMFKPALISKAVGTKAPANQDAIIRYMMGRPLDFNPGTREAYSNFGYCVLGRIIEKVTGSTYEEYVQSRVLKPMGITRMRLGRTQWKDRAKGEVRYYQPNASPVRSVFPSEDKEVAWPYGGFHLEAMDSHGGWLASAIDLARFAARLDVPGAKPLLTPESVRVLYERPKPPVGLTPGGKPTPAYYACGWSVRPVGNTGKANFWHNGSLPGTSTLLVRRWDGLTWVVLFNQRSEGDMPSDNEIDGALHRAADRVKQWPDNDLFKRSRDTINVRLKPF